MPFEPKYSPETREAATAKALELRRANPKDRSVIRVVAEEYSVGDQSLRGWLLAVTPEDERPAKRSRRPKFSPVVTTQDSEHEAESTGTGAAAPVQVSARESPLPAKDPDSDVAALEAEATALRRGNETLKDAMRVLLGA